MSARSAQRSCGICLHKIWNTPWRVGFYVCCWDGGCQKGSGLYGERVVKWDFPHSFFLFDIQSMRSTACVKVQIIWTCTSRWSGSIMSTARTCPLSKSMYLNIQRKYLINSILLYLPLWPRDWCFPCSVFVLQLVWTICHHVVGREWRSVQRFSTWSPGEGQKRRGNCFYLHPLLCKMLAYKQMNRCCHKRTHSLIQVFLQVL